MCTLSFRACLKPQPCRFVQASLESGEGSDASDAHDAHTTAGQTRMATRELEKFLKEHDKTQHWGG